MWKIVTALLPRLLFIVLRDFNITIILGLAVLMTAGDWFLCLFSRLEALVGMDPVILQILSLCPDH
jgi:hypothetical protein